MTDTKIFEKNTAKVAPPPKKSKITIIQYFKTKYTASKEFWIILYMYIIIPGFTASAPRPI